MVGFLPVISPNVAVDKGVCYGLCGHDRCREPVGAFGWYRLTAIEAFPGGRVWLVPGSVGRSAGYASCCLAKRSWALLRSTPTRDNQAKAGESPAGLGRLRPGPFRFAPLILLPCHASQNLFGRRPEVSDVHLLSDLSPPASR